jgi:hypothetical protein
METPLHKERPRGGLGELDDDQKRIEFSATA